LPRLNNRITANAHAKYKGLIPLRSDDIPEWLLAEWGLDVDPTFSDAA
jgi:hypothetical protein